MKSRLRTAPFLVACGLFIVAGLAYLLMPEGVPRSVLLGLLAFGGFAIFFRAWLGK